MDDRDFDDPMTYLNGLEIAVLAVRLPPCRHCTVTTAPVHLGRNGYALDVTHEGACPENEDNQPACEQTITPYGC